MRPGVMSAIYEADSAAAVRYREDRIDWDSGSKRDGMAG